ncbi:unnamed protein product [Arctia plantaginis]|uniref:Uncharacterized protein n=1 Tax=Arctia plantaginis TaxID=874455 RepID=A0A8S1A004_ARCPL|nr:unnamed protein product [Arctia plantaginis]
MFSERTHQVQVINEDFQEIQPKHDSTAKKTDKFELLQNQFTKYFKLFLNTSSIHGLNHIVAARRQFMESILWLSIIVISGYGSLYLSSITWGRYQSSPTVISMDRDMFAWNTTFPCVTICPNGILNIDPKKLELYLNNSKVENKTALQSFIIGLANASYKSFEFVPEYFEVPPEEYVDLLLNLSLEFKPTLTIGVANVALNVVPTITEMGLCYAINSRTAIYNSPDESKESNKTRLKNFILKLANATYNTFEDVPSYPDIHPDEYLSLLLNLSLPLKPLFTGSLKMTVALPTVTEMGICYAVNSRTAVYNSPEYLAANRWDVIPNENETFYAHPLDGEVFVKLTMNRGHSFTIYVHGPQETPDITSKSHVLLETLFLKIYVTALTVYTSPEAAK